MKKRVLSSILCLAMLLVAVINPIVSYAAEPDNYLAVAEYRNQGGKNIAPTAPEGKVFAGWYKDAEFTKPWGENITAEKAYAKFVNKEVLSVKWQVLDDTATDSKTTDARFLTTVDSVNYKEVGFILTVGGMSTEPQMSNTVYERIAGWVDGNANYYEPTVFDETSLYFMVWELLEVPNEAFATDITVDAVWTTLDGTTVTGNNTDANVAEVLVEADFDAGVTFEYPKHAKVTTSATRVKYEDTSIGAQPEAYGEYGLQKSATGSAYPHVVVNYNKTYPVGSLFTCKLYVEVDEQVLTDLGDNAYYWMGSWQADVTPDVKITRFNEWIDVSYILKAASVSSLDFFCNFAVGGGNESTKFGNNAVTVYADNIQVIAWDYSKGVTFENSVETGKAITSGSASLTTSDYSALSLTEEEKAIYGETAMKFEVNGNWPNFTLNLEKTYPAGAKLCFSIYAKADATQVAEQIFWVDNDDATKHPFNEWTKGFARIKEDASTKSLFLNFESARSNTSNTPITVYLDNFYISEGDFEKGIDLENEADKHWFTRGNTDYTIEEFDGKHAIKMDITGSKWPSVNVQFKQAYSSLNTRLCFNVYVEADATQVSDQIFYVGDDDGTQHKFNTWNTSFVRVADGLTSKGIMVNLDKAITALGSNFPFTIYITDFYLTVGDTVAGLDLENPAERYLFWKDGADYTFEEFAGSTAMKMTITQNWPGVRLGLKEQYTENKKLYFKMYAKVDKNLVTDEVFYVGNDDPNKHPFNKWTEGFVTISANSGSGRPWFNFEAALKTIGSGNITLYLDDFEIR